MAEASHEVLDPRGEGIVAAGAHLQWLWSGGIWCEGPVYLPGADRVLWSDIPNDRVMGLDRASGEVREALAPAGYANGHTLDLEGRLVACEHGGRRISRDDGDGTMTTVVDRHDGAPLNSPNDVVVRSDATIWFTDPTYGIDSVEQGGRVASREQTANHVYRFDPADGSLEAVVDIMDQPNGLAFSPDESVLYVSDTSLDDPDDRLNHHILAFDVVDGRRAENGRTFAVVQPGVPDGFRIDTTGRLYSSAADGLHIYDPDGTRLVHIPVPEVVANCAFGGQQGTTLYITATTSLYAIELTTHDAAARRIRHGADA